MVCGMWTIRAVCGLEEHTSTVLLLHSTNQCQPNKSPFQHPVTLSDLCSPSFSEAHPGDSNHFPGEDSIGLYIYLSETLGFQDKHKYITELSCLNDIEVQFIDVTLLNGLSVLSIIPNVSLLSRSLPDETGVTGEQMAWMVSVCLDHDKPPSI